jgi:hypothetical protein
MKNCPSCGKEVSKSAKICPNCGRKLKKPIFLFIILGIILLLIIGAVISGNEEAARKKDFIQDETAIYNDVHYSITNVERTQGEQYFEAAEGKEYIILTLKIENKSDQKIPYNTLDWKMVDSTGDENTYAIWGGNENTILSSGDLNPNGIKTGTISFEIPKDDTDLTLRYYETIFSSKHSFQSKLD